MLNEFKGFAVTLKRIVRKPETIEYPDVKRPMPQRFRGLPSLRADPETGEALCVACGSVRKNMPNSLSGNARCAFRRGRPGIG
jgi:NADH-quinone oxidoreductase subunit I